MNTQSLKKYIAFILQCTLILTNYMELNTVNSTCTSRSWLSRAFKNIWYQEVEFNLLCNVQDYFVIGGLKFFTNLHVYITSLRCTVCTHCHTCKQALHVAWNILPRMTAI